MCSDPAPLGFPAVYREIESEGTTPHRSVSICCGTHGCLPYWGNGRVTMRCHNVADASLSDLRATTHILTNLTRRSLRYTGNEALCRIIATHLTCESERHNTVILELTILSAGIRDRASAPKACGIDPGDEILSLIASLLGCPNASIYYPTCKLTAVVLGEYRMLHLLLSQREDVCPNRGRQCCRNRRTTSFAELQVDNLPHPVQFPSPL